MSNDEQNNGDLDSKGLLEVLQLLQKGENTASSMEQKLDNVEKELNVLLEQMDQMQSKTSNSVPETDSKN